MHLDVEELTRVVLPSAGRRPRARPEVEARLGAVVPEDFKDLVDTYGGGALRARCPRHRPRADRHR
ncbi:SMI1/KNR4 family protein [Streptomyces sp. NBC_00841]|uniref:hypothetical protein n=1 Tax=unclassified Streptomyces TaxID=2593676 RepID=UPI002250160C|nr:MULTISPECIES: hypothetical protein [unclassified Streptomyces]MCX4537633.1 SMI1/KNR4 family protein [Streptomyces sp. NBC_01669]WRZ97157.1 SMI1/KNR4 family protein [Streptomyces sp. NBC_00841]